MVRRSEQGSFSYPWRLPRFSARTTSIWSRHCRRRLSRVEHACWSTVDGVGDVCALGEAVGVTQRLPDLGAFSRNQAAARLQMGVIMAGSSMPSRPRWCCQHLVQLGCRAARNRARVPHISYRHFGCAQMLSAGPQSLHIERRRAKPVGAALQTPQGSDLSTALRLLLHLCAAARARVRACLRVLSVRCLNAPQDRCRVVLRLWP